METYGKRSCSFQVNVVVRETGVRARVGHLVGGWLSRVLGGGGKGGRMEKEGVTKLFSLITYYSLTETHSSLVREVSLAATCRHASSMFHKVKVELTHYFRFQKKQPTGELPYIWFN